MYVCISIYIYIYIYTHMCIHCQGNNSAAESQDEGSPRADASLLLSLHVMTNITITIIIC